MGEFGCVCVSVEILENKVPGPLPSKGSHSDGFPPFPGPRFSAPPAVIKGFNVRFKIRFNARQGVRVGNEGFSKRARTD